MDQTYGFCTGFENLRRVLRLPSILLCYRLTGILNGIPTASGRTGTDHSTVSAGLQVTHFAFTRDHFAQHQPEFLAHKEVTEEELKDYPSWATKISDPCKLVGDEWFERLAVDEKAQDDVISHRIH